LAPFVTAEVIKDPLPDRRVCIDGFQAIYFLVVSCGVLHGIATMRETALFLHAALVHDTARIALSPLREMLTGEAGTGKAQELRRKILREGSIG